MSTASGTQGTEGGGKGKKGGKGKTVNAKGKGTTGKSTAETTAKACVDFVRAAAATDSAQPFPKDSVALDSWANVWLKHVKNQPESYFQDVLHLAHGECYGHRETSAHGVPVVFVPWSLGGDNIDLFPEGFLWERGCDITRSDDLIVRTPKGREFQMQMWGNMPYVSKDILHKILQDLPVRHVAGRNGRPADTPTAARVANVCVNLEHLREDIPKEELCKMRAQ